MKDISSRQVDEGSSEGLNCAGFLGILADGGVGRWLS